MFRLVLKLTPPRPFRDQADELGLKMDYLLFFSNGPTKFPAHIVQLGSWSKNVVYRRPVNHPFQIKSIPQREHALHALKSDTNKYGFRNDIQLLD